MEGKRYHIIAASFFFAFLLWLSVNLRSEYTVVKTLPVTIKNLKPGTALKYPVPKNVAVSIHGKGLAIAGLYLISQIYYEIDASSLSNKDYFLTKTNLIEHISLPGNVELLDINPDTIRLALDEFQEKMVVISPRIILNYQEGYGQVGPFRILPESVLISGSKTALETINSWPTAYKKFDNIKSSIDFNLPLEQSEFHSIELTITSTRLMVNVQPFAEKTFSGIPVKAIGVPPNREVVFIPPKIDLIVRGGIEQLANLQEQDFSITVNYDALPQDTVILITPAVSGPSDVKIVGKKPEQFQFIIRKKL